MEVIGLFLLLTAIAVIIVVFQVKKENSLVKELGAIKKITMGRYLIGFSNVPQPMNNVECAITDDNFIFILRSGTEVFKIPRDSINEISLSDKSQITKRITATRILTLGIFSLAVPKTKKLEEFCVIIDWDDENGEKQNAIFEFTGTMAENLAIHATNTLNQFKKRKAAQLKSSEKACPYCAEIIKKEANICRFCGNTLVEKPQSSVPKNAGTIIHFACPDCSAKYKANRELAGKKGKCAKCGKIITVPKV